jgi:7,8-dihydropterin-6-yl-methyl-4-(beta-D-ribofuranosyl)aminobenzene 5'-phosphate synthase
MSAIHDFGETESATVTVLVDNRADAIVRSSRAVKYFTAGPLLAEHGFAALIDLGPTPVRILWDAGAGRTTLLENMRRMRIAPVTIGQIALSHGHDDHTGGMAEILRAMDIGPHPRKWQPGTDPEEIRAWMGAHRVPLIAHPAVFRERWVLPADGSKHGPMLPPRRGEWEGAGAEIIPSEGPYRLAPGCWTTGYIPRVSFERSGRSATLAYREGKAFLRDHLEDDQALAINVSGKGLVIVSGCAHSGILNTVRYAQEISGVERVWAILGGFHLATSSDEDIRRTVGEIGKYSPALIVPSHCTGFRAMSRCAGELPEQCIPGLVGAAYPLKKTSRKF